MQPHYFLAEWIRPTDRVIDTDVCLYGGTVAAIVAAVRLRQLGHTVALLNPGMQLGGMTAGGLGWTDRGNSHVIGGMAREFYRRVADAYRADGREPVELPEQWRFEPRIASAAIARWLDEVGVEPLHAQFLESVAVDGRAIREVRMLGGLRVRAKLFLDATYEGDLMAAAGVPFTVGRESNRTYHETINGIQVHHKHQFAPAIIDPFLTPGDPGSGMLPGIIATDMRALAGQGDNRIQAYNFRVCMTDDPALRLDWQRPERYKPLWYEAAARWFGADDADVENRLLNPDAPGRDPHLKLNKYDVLPVRTPGGFHKTDTNNHGPVSSDFIGQNYDWPRATYAQREAMFQQHLDWQQGLYWFLAHDERVPDVLRIAHSRWGLPRDEFVETGHWPWQLYVREARRMLGDCVLTEHHCKHRVVVDDPIAMGSYNIDSHNCSRFVAQLGGRPALLNEGDVQTPPAGPYGISYRCAVPPAGSIENLFVPVCVSASHIAYGSVRMEPVFMALAESCAEAASLALHDRRPVQGVNYRALRLRLEDAGQVLTFSERKPHQRLMTIKTETRTADSVTTQER